MVEGGDGVRLSRGGGGGGDMQRIFDGAVYQSLAASMGVSVTLMGFIVVHEVFRYESNS